MGNIFVGGMMKKIILLIGMLLLCSAVYAAEGNVTVYSFKVYAEGENLGVDWDDDTIIANPGSNVEVQIRLENEHNETVDVDIEGTLFEVGNDIVRDAEIEIDEGDKKTTVFEYYLPTDLRESNYELEIHYEYTVDGKDYEHTRTFELDVRKKKTTIDDILVNLTRELVEGKNENNELLQTVLDMTETNTKLGTCESSLGALREANGSNSEFREKYFAIESKEANTSIALATCTTERNNMYSKSQLDMEKERAAKEARQETSREKDNFIMLIGGGVVIYFIMQKKKKQVGGEGEGKSLTATW